MKTVETHQPGGFIQGYLCDSYLPGCQCVAKVFAILIHCLIKANECDECAVCVKDVLLFLVLIQTEQGW